MLRYKLHLIATCNMTAGQQLPATVALQQNNLHPLPYPACAVATKTNAAAAAQHQKIKKRGASNKQLFACNMLDALIIQFLYSNILYSNILYLKDTFASTTNYDQPNPRTV